MPSVVHKRNIKNEIKKLAIPMPSSEATTYYKCSDFVFVFVWFGLVELNCTKLP